jgi:hypothetical protein
MSRQTDVRSPAAVRALSFLITIVLAAAAPWISQARDPQVDVAACVDFGESNVDDGVTTRVTLTSSCAAALRCEIKWKLSCDEGEAAKPDRRRLTLGAKKTQQVDVSASHCGDGLWELSELSWSCVQR